MSQGKKRETIFVGGMTCVGCARTLENEFRQFGDVDYTVSFADKAVTVIYSPDNHSRTEFEQAIESHGYRIKDKTY